MVHFTAMRDLARKELVECFDQYSGPKLLVWDVALTGPLDMVAGVQFLKERQVIQMLPLKPGRLPPATSSCSSDADNIVFFSRPDVELMDRIADNVKGEENGGSSQRKEFHLVFIPHRSLLCERRLKDKGVFGSFTFVDELPIFWFPLETDVLSMERCDIFREFHLDGDPTSLHSVARALVALQAVYGTIPNVYGKGKAAMQVFEFMKVIRKEMAGEVPQGSPQIDNLVILDRQIDLISPLVTQLTYEGLIDELFSIRHNAVRLPAVKFGPPDSDEVSGGVDDISSASDIRIIPLSSTEEVYADLRDRNFNAVGPALSRKARTVSAQFQERHDANTVRELRQFVDKIPQMRALKQSLATHTTIAEMIKERTDQRQFLEALQVEQELLNFQNTDRALEYVEDATCQEEHLLRVLRILCLQSVVNSGLKPKILDGYRRQILQTYGHHLLLSLHNLDRLGLLTSPQLSSRNYAVLRKRLNLTLDDVDEQNPADAAYVHSVYAPLMIRLLERLAQPPGWKAVRDGVLDLLPGPAIEEVQMQLPVKTSLQQVNAEKKTTTLVMFVGGSTFAEISALRFLSNQEDWPVEYVVATTAVINGNSFLKSLMTEIRDPLHQ